MGDLCLCVAVLWAVAGLSADSDEPGRGSPSDSDRILANGGERRVRMGSKRTTLIVSHPVPCSM